MTERSHKGLVQREITVRRGGKSFKQMRWVKPGDEEPKERKGKKEEVKDKLKVGGLSIGDEFLFLGNKMMSVEKISEKEQTAKLSNGIVYTIEAIAEIRKRKESESKPKEEKPKEKEIKHIIPDGTPITKENIEETLKIGSKITMRGNAAIITNRNDNIIEYTYQNGSKNLGSINGLIDEGATTRIENKSDIVIAKKQEKKLKSVEKTITSREAQFNKPRRGSKKIGAKTIPTKLKVGDSIIIDGKESKVEKIEKNVYHVGGKIYATKTIHKITEKYPLVTGDKVKGNYKFTNNKEQDAKISETINKLDNLMLDGKSLDAAVREITGGKKGTLESTINLPNFETKQTKIVNETIKKLDNYISPKYKKSNLEINIVTNTTGRSYANSEINQISLNNKGDIASTLMHETGHIMENKHGNNHEVIDDFLRSRTGNLQKQEKLNKLFPNSGYSENEITSKDSFIDPYVGKLSFKQKVHDMQLITTDDLRSSEILSMGMERFSNESSMKDFYRKDKEHFAITLSIMAGDFLE